MSIVIKVENLSKMYRLGAIGTGTLTHDLNRWLAKLLGKEDPYLKLGQSNDRTKKGDSDYVWALNDINFEVAQGEVLGIIGKNGAGKSTLLKILSRTTTPTKGVFKAKGRIASLLEVGTGFHPELSGRENIFLNGAILGMTRQEIKSKFEEIVDFSGVERYIDTPVKRYSSGMYVRLAFAVAAHLEPEILIVDEVLAVGDQEFQDKCIGKMKDVSKSGRTVLFVSHNLTSIKELCTKGILMKNGKINDFGKIEKVINSYLGNVNLESVVFPDKNLNPVYKLNSWITKISLINDKKETTNFFKIGSEFNIHAEYDSVYTEKIEDFCIAFAITSVSGENICDLSNIYTNGYKNAVRNKGSIICKIPVLYLNEGTYKLNAAISVKGVDQYWIKDVIWFRVDKFDYYGSGIVPNPRDGSFIFDQKWIIDN